MSALAVGAAVLALAAPAPCDGRPDPPPRTGAPLIAPHPNPRLGRQARAWLRAHRAAFGGIWIVGDGPRDAFLVVAMTGDAERHERALRRRTDARIHVRRVEHSLRELRAVQARIEPEAVSADGLQLTSWGADVQRNRVFVELITERPLAEAQALLRERYGPLVEARIVARHPYRLECTPLSTYETLDDGRTLRLIWTTNSEYELEEVVVAEDAETVWVGIVERVPNGPVTLMAVTREELLWLSEGVGGRTVRDAATGRALRPQG